MKINYPLLIDGGLSNELEKAGYDLNHKLWSAKLLETNPEAIVQVHLNYLKSGAKCITTSSYQASIPGFMAMGYDRTSAESLIVKSVQLAEKAINQFMTLKQNGSRPLIAASIGPYGAYLADGSEYHGDYGITGEELADFHLERIGLLDDSNADFIACETIPSFQEAYVLSEILKKTKKQAWISFSCMDKEHINDGTPIKKCAELLSNHANVFAIGINCTAPKHISGLIKAIKEKSGTKKIVVYPNSGEVYHAKSKTWASSSDPDIFVTMAKEWFELGVDILGGCCRIGSVHIKSLDQIIQGR